MCGELSTIDTSREYVVIVPNILQTSTSAIGGGEMCSNSGCLEQVQQQKISHKRPLVVQMIQNTSDQGIIKKKKIMNTMVNSTLEVLITTLDLLILAFEQTP